MRSVKLQTLSFLKIIYVVSIFLGLPVILPPNIALAVDITESVRLAIEESIADSSEWERVEVSGIRLKPGISLSNNPAGDPVIEVVEILPSRPLGRRNFQMLARFDDNEKHFRASAVVKAYRRVFYLTRSLYKGQPVAKSDIVSREMDVSRVPKGALSDPSELEGLVASRSIGINRVLKLSYFKELPAARKGSRVLLVADNGPVKVAVPGILKEDAYKGRSVKAMNIMSRKEVVGWLVDAGTVSIRF